MKLSDLKPRTVSGPTKRYGAEQQRSTSFYHSSQPIEDPAAFDDSATEAVEVSPAKKERPPPAPAQKTARVSWNKGIYPSRTPTFTPIDTEKAVWTIQTGLFHQSAHSGDLAQLVARRMFRNPSAYNPLYEVLLEGLRHESETVIEFRVVATGTIPGRKDVSLIKAEAGKWKNGKFISIGTFILSSSFTRDFRSAFVR